MEAAQKPCKGSRSIYKIKPFREDDNHYSDGIKKGG